MNDQNQAPWQFDPVPSGARFTRQLPPEEGFYLPASRRYTRGSCLGRIGILLLVWLFGVAVGLGALFWYGLSAAGPLVLVPKTTQGNVIVEADAAFVTQLVQQDLANAGLPGKVQNVRVELEHGAQMIISGDDTGPVLGVTLTRHFTVNLQPYAQSCVMQVRVTHADLGGLPVTTFAQSFQSSINAQLSQKPGALPSGFKYCATGVRTEPGGMFITYQVTSSS